MGLDRRTAGRGVAAQSATNPTRT